MEVAISHLNHNIAGPHPDGTASLIVGGMVRIDGQRGLGQYQGGLFPICKNILGFVAELCQASYVSNAKTTYRTRPPEHPHRRSRESGNPGQGRGAGASPSPVIPAPHPRVIPGRQESRGESGGAPPPTYPVAGALRESVRAEPVEGSPSPPAHPDTSPWRPSQRPRYPSPMQHACNDLNQDIASTSASWRSSPAPLVSTTMCASAPDSRRLFRTGAKVAQRCL